MVKTARDVINSWGLDEEAYEKTDSLIEELEAAGFVIVGKSDMERAPEALREIERKYTAIMKAPPDWTSFTGPDDPRLMFAREAWFGAAQIAKRGLNG